MLYSLLRENRTLRALSKAVFTLGLALALAPLPASALPELQVYIEGAVYDAGSESWVLAGGPVRLWAIGNVDGPGGKGPISDVRLSIAYGATPGPVSVTLTPSTTGGLGGFFDPSTSLAVTFLQERTDGTAPLLSDGGALPSHGVYGAGTYWQEFLLGDFTLTDSPMADFIDSFPVSPTTAKGQINVYEVSVSGTSEVHFDLYNSYIGNPHAKAVFAPFSHDGDSTTTQVPEPGPLALMAAGLLALVLIRRRRA